MLDEWGFVFDRSYTTLLYVFLFKWRRQFKISTLFFPVNKYGQFFLQSKCDWFSPRIWAGYILEPLTRDEDSSRKPRKNMYFLDSCVSFCVIISQCQTSKDLITCSPDSKRLCQLPNAVGIHPVISPVGISPSLENQMSDLGPIRCDRPTLFLLWFQDLS